MQHKNILVLLAFFILPLSLFSQFKKFYPSPQEVQIYETDMQSKGPNGEKCLSGNCEDGDGTLLIYRSFGNYTRTSNISVLYYVLKGTFSNKSREFTGTMHLVKVPYHVVSDGMSKTKYTFTPETQVNLNDEAILAANEVGTGSMKRSSGDIFFWNGNVQFRIKPGQVFNGEKILSFNAWFEEFYHQMQYVDIVYESGSRFSRVQGSVTNNGEFVGGRLSYSDGSVYEGYLCNNKFFGPGKLVQKSGEVSEGIRMMDSLSMPTAVNLPPLLFHYVPFEESATRMKFGNQEPRQIHSSGGNWKYIDRFTTANISGNNYTGPGIYISQEFIDEGVNSYLLHNYYTGNFEDGYIKKGMKVVNKIPIRSPGERGSFIVYGNKKSSLVTGEYSDDRLVRGSCARKIFMDHEGKPVRLLEGSFTPMKVASEEQPDGWVYENDWSGTRDPALLKYFYSGYELIKIEAGYDYWIREGYKDAVRNNFCIDAMKTNATATLGRLKFMNDSLDQVIANKNLAIKEQEERNRKWREGPDGKAYFAKLAAEQKTCDSLNAGGSLGPGSLFKKKNSGYKASVIFIASKYNCSSKSWEALNRNWVETIKNKGYYTIGDTKVSLQTLKKDYEQEPGKYDICNVCNGYTGSFNKVVNEVGGNSGYTDLGNGWAVKNPETYWVSTVFSPCQKCKGEGFIKK